MNSKKDYYQIILHLIANHKNSTLNNSLDYNNQIMNNNNNNSLISSCIWLIPTLMNNMLRTLIKYVMDLVVADYPVILQTIWESILVVAIGVPIIVLVTLLTRQWTR